MIVVTGASGQLGRLAVEALLKRGVPAGEIVAAVRTPAKAADLAAKGVLVRVADYDKPETLDAAFQGADKLLLVSSSEVGKRAPQHAAAIAASVRAGVKLVVYTSLLHADTSPLGLAVEHVATEKALVASGLPHVVLRNAWYLENHVGTVAGAVAHGVVIGAAGEGLFSSAARADFAKAAAVVLTTPGHAGKVYELAGDASFTLADFAATIASISGKPVNYVNMGEAELTKALVGVGLPEPLAAMLADSDVGASKGALFDDSKTLSGLIGRPTTTLADLVRAALA